MRNIGAVIFITIFLIYGLVATAFPQNLHPESSASSSPPEPPNSSSFEKNSQQEPQRAPKNEVEPKVTTSKARAPAEEYPPKAAPQTVLPLLAISSGVQLLLLCVLFLPLWRRLAKVENICTVEIGTLRETAGRQTKCNQDFQMRLEGLLQTQNDITASLGGDGRAGLAGALKELHDKVLSWESRVNGYHEEASAASQNVQTLTRLLDKLKVDPKVNLYAADLGSFCTELMKQHFSQNRRIQEGQLVLERLARALMKLKAFEGSYTTYLGEMRTRTGDNAQQLLDYLEGVRRKISDYRSRLENVIQRHQSVFQATTIPSFEDYTAKFLDKNARTADLDLRPSFFEDVLRGYARELAILVTEKLKATPDDRIAEELLPALQKEATEAMLSSLVALRDYLAAPTRAAAPVSVPDHLSSSFEAFISRLDEELRKISLESISPHVNEDTYDPSLHELVKRLGDGQVVCKVEMPGFIWDHVVLRRAQVWVK